MAPDPCDLNLGPALVTGGTGFLGRRIVQRLLAAGRPVTVLARRAAPDLERSGVRCLSADLRDANAVRGACRGMKTVFHTAARVGVWGRRREFFETNVGGTRALLEGCLAHGVPRLVYTSTLSVVYNGRNLSGITESLPLTTACPASYPLTKAVAEREVLAADSRALHTISLRPHLIWGVGDPHLVPRVLDRARAGRLRIVGTGRNRVDLVHVNNVADAHLLAERALAAGTGADPDARPSKPPAAGRAYFITNGEPVALWDWISDLLRALGRPPVTRHLAAGAAVALGAACELCWRVFPLGAEPPMTRFVARELALDHWADISAARRDLGYTPRVSMAAGTAELVEHLLRVDAGHGENSDGTGRP